MTHEGLSRGIRKWDLVALLVNVTVGAGIFRLPADAQKAVGNYSLAAFGVCACLIGLIALCFAEVGSRFTRTGGPYIYARASFGPTFAFLIGWLMWLTRLAGFATLLLVFVDYLGYFWPAAGSGLSRIAIITGLVGALTLINLLGVKESARTSDIFTVSKLLPLLVFVAVGVFFINWSRFSFALTPTVGSFSSAVFILIYGFSGFEAVLVNSGEIHEPRRSVPFGLLVALVIVVALFLLIQVVSIGTLPELANSERPLADASYTFLGAAGPTMISIGALISIFGTLNVIMLATSRLPYAMAIHRQLPAALGRVHNRFRTPHVSIIVTAIAVLFLALPGTVIYTLNITVITRVIVYASTCLALPILRRRAKADPVQTRSHFAVPGGTFIAAICIVLCLCLLANSGWHEARDVGLAVGVGLVIYAATRLLQRKKAAADVPIE